MPRQEPWSIYKQQMECHKRGDALWDPSPTQHYTRIKIGDVGFIDKGKFHLLFSAGSPLGERQLGRDVPEKFEPLNVGTTVSGEPRRPDCLRTPTVRHIGAGTTEFISLLLENRASCSFELTGDSGAALLTMDPTHPEDCSKPSEREFAEYAERHYQSWVDFSRHRRGSDSEIRPILVSGFDMTKNSAMVAYSRDNTFRRGHFSDSPMFRPAFAPFKGTWRANFLPYTNQGPPQRDTPTSHPQSEDAGSLANERDQCVFLRYYTMRTRGWWMGFRKELVQVGAGLRDPDPGNKGGDTSPGPTGESDAESTARDVGRQVGLNTGSADSELDVVVRNTQHDEGHENWDIIADYVFQNSNATSVLMHHRDIAEIRAVGDSSDLSSLLATKRPRIVVGESGVGRIVRGEDAQLAQQETTPPDLHPRRTLTSSSSSQTLHKLHSLDAPSSEFIDQLSDLLHGEEYQQRVPNLQSDGLAGLVDYLDEGLNGLDLTSVAAGKCLRELKGISALG